MFRTLHRSEEGIGSLRPGVTDDCEVTHGCWELNLDPSAKAEVLFTAGPTLQPFAFPVFILKKTDLVYSHFKTAFKTLREKKKPCNSGIISAEIANISHKEQVSVSWLRSRLFFLYITK